MTRSFNLFYYLILINIQWHLLWVVYFVRLDISRFDIQHILDLISILIASERSVKVYPKYSFRGLNMTALSKIVCLWVVCTAARYPADHCSTVLPVSSHLIGRIDDEVTLLIPNSAALGDYYQEQSGSNTITDNLPSIILQDLYKRKLHNASPTRQGMHRIARHWLQLFFKNNDISLICNSPLNSSQICSRRVVLL